MADGSAAWIPAPLAGAIGGIGTLLAGVPVIDKRLGHVEDIERQLGKQPRTVQVLYVGVNRAYKVLLLILLVPMALAALSFVMPGLAPYFQNRGTALMLTWAGLSIAMYLNVGSWVLIGLTTGFTRIGEVVTPHRITRLSRQAGYDTLIDFVTRNEASQPLAVNALRATELVERTVASARRTKLVPDRAEAPAALRTETDRSVRGRFGNALLFGCIIEEAHHDFPKLLGRRSWRSFYAAIADLASDVTFFDPAVVRTITAFDSHTDLILSALNKRLVLLGQGALAQSDDLRQRLTRSLEFVASQELAGNITLMVPDEGAAIPPSVDVLVRGIARIPGLKSLAMRNQFLKLAVVWRVLRGLSINRFQFPLAKRLAALLLEREVLAAPSTVKELNFERDRDRRLYQAAMHVLVDEAVRLYGDRRTENSDWLPADSLDSSAEEFAWWMAYEFDLRLWALSHRLHVASDLSDDEKLKSWRCDGALVKRI